VRFRTKERPRGLLKPRDQRRLTMLIGGLGVILICFTVVRRPTFWNGLFPEPPAAEQPEAKSDLQPGSGTAAPVVNETVSPPTINHDEFLIGDEARSGGSPNDVVSVTVNRIPLQDPAENPDRKNTTFNPNLIPRVPEKLMLEVRDDVIGVHSSESEAYFAALKMASVFAERKMNKAPAGAYALFMDAPNGSRGVAWNLEGRLRRLSVVKGQVNALGVGTVYDAWLTTNDSGENLVHAVSMKASPQLAKLVTDTTPDKTIEFTNKTAPMVKFTGYFFKREGYASKKGISLAPLFVAGILQDIPKVVVTSTRADELTPYLGWLSLAICVAVALMVWSFSMSDMAHAQTRAHQLTKLPAHATFEEVTSVTVQETLNQLEMAAQSQAPKLDRFM